jgi:predicted transposase YdaD
MSMPCNWVDGWIKEGEERGEKRGEKRGEQRGRERTALRMLEHGMDAALIAKLAELSEERVRQLAAQSSPH